MPYKPVLRHALNFVLAIAAGQAHAGDAHLDAAPQLPAHASWTVTRAWCPAGCSTATAAALSALQGQGVQLGTSELSAPFIAGCAGQMLVRLQRATSLAIVAEVNRGRAPSARQLVSADLGLAAAGDRAWSGWAICHVDAGDTNLQRLLVVEPDRIVLLGEEQGLIELRPAPAGALVAGSPVAAPRVITDIAHWQHPTKAVFDKYKVTMQSVALRGTHATFNVAFPFDPQTEPNAATMRALCMALLEANGGWSYDLVLQEDRIEINVSWSEKTRTMSFAYRRL